MIAFHLDPHSGVSPYLQIVQQVKRALRLGLLQVGDQLPTVREVIAQITINPNTVFKAYRELEREGLVSSRPGAGTFVRRTLATTSPTTQAELQASLRRWLESALAAGLDGESALALFLSTLQAVQQDAPTQDVPTQDVLTQEAPRREEDPV
jgi:GntR family transcriptional regulator